MARRLPRPRLLQTRRNRDVGVAATSRGMLRRRYDSARATLPLWGTASAILIPAALCCVLLWPWIRAHLQSLAVLELVSGDTLKQPLKSLTTEPFTTQDLTMQTSAGPVFARLYTPTRHPHAPGLVVFHGVHHLGLNEPRLMSFARAMASCGLQVLTPE